MKIVVLYKRDIKDINRTHDGHIQFTVRTARKARAIENAYQRNGAIIASLEEGNPTRYIYDICNSFERVRYCAVKMR